MTSSCAATLPPPSLAIDNSFAVSLRRAIANPVQDAIKQAGTGTRVKRRGVMESSDDGPGVAEAEHEQHVERHGV